MISQSFGRLDFDIYFKILPKNLEIDLSMCNSMNP
jgi:hypothetical protein